MSKTSSAVKNRYNAKAYDQICLMVPKGKKAILQEEARRRNLSLNALIQEAIKEYLNCTD